MINKRDIQYGNYYLDGGGKILRVDEIENAYDDDSKMSLKIGMENIVETEVHPLMSPNGYQTLHPYTEYQKYLEEVDLFYFDENPFEDKINIEIDGWFYNVKLDRISYGGISEYTLYIDNNMECNDENLLTKTVKTVNEVISIVYALIKYEMKIKDKFILNKMK